MPKENISTIHESIKSADELRENPHVKDALAPYLSPLVLARHPELKNPAERLYFQSLLLSDMLPGDKRPRDVRREDLDPSNPLGAPIPAGDDLDAYALIGVELNRALSDSEKSALSGDPSNEGMGKAYATKVREARSKWNAKESITDLHPSIADVVVAHYRDCKKAVNEALAEARIGVPAELGGEGGGGRNTLNRDEYLQLLSLAWQGQIGVAKTIIASADGKVEGLRATLETPGIAGMTRRVAGISADLSLEEMGSGEALRRFDVEIGPMARRDYVDMLRSSPDFKSADVWLSDPQLAYEFLYQRLPVTDGNRSFLAALRRYNETGWKSPSREELDGLGGVSPEDTKAALQLVVTNLMAGADVLKNTRAQYEGMKVDKGPGVALEKKVGDLWEYMKDVREHPAGSLLMWGALIAAGKIAYDTIKKDSGWGKWVLLFGGGAAAYGLYQKHTTGKAYWDDVFESVKAWKDKDAQKPAEEQTIPNLWAEKLDLDARFYDGLGFERRHTKACIAIIEHQPIGSVVDWYDQMHTWDQTKDPKTMPKLPFTLSAKERGLFGKAKRQDIAMLMYRTMDSFFADRGKMVRQEHLGYMLPAGVEKKDDAGLGAAYIRERYVNRRYFTRLIESTIAQVNVESDGSSVTVNMNDRASVDGALDRVIEERPELKAVIDMARVAYLSETEPVGTADWEMWHVFMTETDPEAWNRAGREGAVPANWVTRSLDYAKRVITDARDGKTGPVDLPPVASPKPVDVPPVATPRGVGPTPGPGPTSTFAPGPSSSVGPGPTASPTGGPTASPTGGPTASPTGGPTASPTGGPSASPTGGPTASPTGGPSASPTGGPTASPTGGPSASPTGGPTASPTGGPTASPTGGPTASPTGGPSASPTGGPTASPIGGPSVSPTGGPTASPTGGPTASPTGGPSASPTGGPTASPTGGPSVSPTGGPSVSPTGGPSASPTGGPTASPTGGPSVSPTGGPSVSPTGGPSVSPTGGPSASPTGGPSEEKTGPSRIDPSGPSLDRARGPSTSSDK